MYNANRDTNPMINSDFYKIPHRVQYPEGTECVYSTWTPRRSLVEGVNEVVAFGFQGFIKKFLIEYFNDGFFFRPKEEVLAEYERFITYTLGKEYANPDHIAKLWDLQYLPIKIKAVSEGTLIPIRVPMLTIESTHRDFFWLTNYLETMMSAELWMPTTSATLALQFRKILEKKAKETSDDYLMALAFMAHDFHMRGASGVDAARRLIGPGHLLSFSGTDTMPAIDYMEKYYNANIETELVGSSVPATEHSVMCANGQDEYEVFKRLITKVHPTGIVSIVSDTWDFWGIIEHVLPRLKDIIEKRDGKVVIRPDSGNPEKILCGDPDSDNEFARKGLIRCLYEIFGGKVNSKGFIELAPCIGAIYGDAITIERCTNITNNLERQGFAGTNVVFGIGSFTYQYNTRDTFGFALKATHVVIKGEERAIFKDPKTDDGTKKSLRGRVVLLKDNEGKIFAKDNLTIAEQQSYEGEDLLKTIFLNGKLLHDDSLMEIRKRVSASIK